MVLDLNPRVCLVLLFAAAAGLEDGLLLPCAAGIQNGLCAGARRPGAI